MQYVLCSHKTNMLDPVQYDQLLELKVAQFSYSYPKSSDISFFIK